MIFFKNVTKIYKSNHFQTIALEDINLEIKEKEFLCLVGKSGAGKTTLLRLLIGEEKPTKGRVLFQDIEVNRLQPHQLPKLRRRIGMIFQDFKLLPKKTCFENVAFALEVCGRSQRQIKELVPQLLELVGLLEKKDNFPYELSGGEKQRVAIARALVHQPDVIVADEPTGNLDPINTWEIINLLLKINELGTTVILATHNKEIIDKIQKRVVCLDQGKIIRDQKRGEYLI